MRRFFTILLVAVTLLSLIACKADQNPSSENSSSISDLPLEVSANKTVSFSDYPSLVQAFTEATSSDGRTLTTETSGSGKVFEKTLSSYRSGKIKPVIPLLNGKEFPLQNQEGYSNITVHTSELYGLPWVWFHCVWEGHRVNICISNISILDHAELKNAKSYVECLKILAPNAPTPENFREFDSYSNISEKEVALDNGETVTAMISETEDQSRTYFAFSQNGSLAVICFYDFSDVEYTINSFFPSFSLGGYELTA